MNKPRRVSRADARVERRRLKFVGLIETATEPSHKLGYGLDYLRTVLATLDVDEAWRIADQLSAQLVATAQGLEPKTGSTR